MTITRPTLLTRPTLVAGAVAAVAVLSAVSAAPALAVPDGCAGNPECLVEHVFGGAGGAPVLPAAAAPAISVVGAQPALAGAGRGARVTIRVRVSSVSVLEARLRGVVSRVRRLVGPGVHTVRISLGRGVRPGRHRVELSATDGAGRRGVASAEVVVVGSPARIARDSRIARD